MVAYFFNSKIKQNFHLNQINPREVYTQDFYEVPNYASPERICNVDAYCDELLCEEEAGEEMNSCSCSSISGCCPAKVKSSIRGKKGAQYMRHAAFCLNSQTYPDQVSDYFMSFLFM